MWNPPPNVTEHQGAPLAPDGDFFADPPSDIGPIRTAHTSLRQGVRPKSAAVRLAIALARGALLEILLLVVGDQAQGIFSRKLSEPHPPYALALVLIPVALLAASTAWFKMGFTHTGTYVGEDGVAWLSCKRSRANIKGGSLFHFKNATALVTSLTNHYKNTAYTHTSFSFSWYSSTRTKPVLTAKGSHTSRTGHPPPGDRYHFYRSAESAWYQYLTPRMEAELAQKGRITFYTAYNGWAALGPGFIEIKDREGKVSRFAAGEIGVASPVTHRLQITRVGVEFNPLDFSKREGVYWFDLTAHNQPMFRYFLKRCLGVNA